MLPRVRALAQAMREQKAEFDRHRQALEILTARTDSEGDRLRAPIARHREAMEQIAAAVRSLIDETQGLGVEIKGIDEGLLDFPSERDGRVVYLCWKLDEPDIAFWHDLETGFAGRRPL